MKRIVTATCVASLLALLLISGSPTIKVRAQKNPYRLRQVENFVPGRVLVGFRDNVLPDHARNVIAALGARDSGEISGLRVHVIDLPEEADEKGFAEALVNRPEIEFAEVDRLL